MVYLIRHAHAGGRQKWSGEDRIRPLSDRGREQALKIAARLSGIPITRIVSSASVRCTQTVEPLATSRGIPLETDPRVYEGAGLDAAFAFVSELGSDQVAVCSHGDIIGGILTILDDLGARLPDEPRCGKGSIWMLDFPPGTGGRINARYLPPPV